MEEELSREHPKSFKLNRKSKFACKLKSLISRRLHLLCPHFSDDVLAEYITVLVCNGKNQIQARDDLEAFLGGRTQEFVSWLWKLILKNETHVSASVALDSCDTNRDRGNVNMNESLDNLERQANIDSAHLMDECDKICHSPNQACKSDDMELAQDCHHPPPKEMTNSLFQSVIPSKEEANLDTSTKVLSSATKYQIETVDDFEKASTLVATPHCSQLSDKDTASVLGRPSASLPESCPSSGRHSSYVSNQSECSQMLYARNSLKRNFFLVPVDLPSHTKKPHIEKPHIEKPHVEKPHKSVWDRLGKRHHDASCRSQTTGFRKIDKNLQIPKPAKQIGQVSPLFPHPRVEGSRRLGLDHRIERKSQFGKIGGHAGDGMVMEKRANNQYKQSSQSHKISKQVNDVKLRLCQIEKEMVKLRTAQLLKKDGNTNLLTNSGAIKPTKDESRTVFVTNVHVGATKETLSMYFQKCGAVVDVILADNIPLAQERSAYITFQDKEAAERALGFNGASFYSRTIKVSRNGENASTTTAPTQIAGKNLHVSHSKNNSAPEGHSFSKSQLKWSLSSVQPNIQSSACVQTKAAAESAC